MKRILSASISLLAFLGATSCSAKPLIVNLTGRRILTTGVLIDPWGGGIKPNNQVIEDGEDIVLITTEDHSVVLFDGNLGAGSAFDLCNLGGGKLIRTPADLIANDAEFPGQKLYRITVTAGDGTFPGIGGTFGLACGGATGANNADCDNNEKFTVNILTSSPTNTPTKSPTKNPTKSPTTPAPTDQPTNQPTQFPVIEIDTALFWGIPKAIDGPKRFEQEAFITEGESITFQMIGNHNLFEFNNKEAFDACDFDDAVELSVGQESFNVGIFNEGQERFFGCNKTKGTQLHCANLNQKMRVVAVPRGETQAITWAKPLSQDEIDLLAKKKEVFENEIIRFAFDTSDTAAVKHTVFQFLNKEAFDACDFTQSFSINLFSKEQDGLNYHDMFAKAGKPGFDKLYFGCKTLDEDQQKTHCELGQKVTFDVVLQKGVNNGDDDDDDDDDNGKKGDATPIVIAGIAAGVVVIGIIAFVILRRGRAGESSAAIEVKHLDRMDEQKVPAPVQKMSADVEVEKTPYRNTVKSQESGTTGGAPSMGTSSLARNKAALSGLNF